MWVDFLIDGESVGAEGGALFTRQDPVTDKVASEAAAATPADVKKVVGAASRAFAGWSETGPSHRRALLNKAADLMEARAAEFEPLMIEEIGATGPTVHDEGQMPFGGVKASGYGRFGGKAVIAEFTDLRWITIEGPQRYPS